MASLADAISSITDPYERQARLWPALLALVPLLVMLGAIYAPRLSAFSNILSLVVACGGLYLLAQISRHRGKALEERLYSEWGGRPSTQLLRHRNTTIESATKTRYHAFLAKKTGQTFPSPDEEKTDPNAADETYQSSVRWLLNQTRDQARFDLLFKENISYGFHRNALGLKPFAIAVALGCAFFVLAKYGVVTSTGLSDAQLSALPDGAWLSLIVSLVAVGIWTVFITRQAVKVASFTYAEMLLRACDSL